jgi:threonine/homoserine/homoserine lactone efflux protein
LIPQGAYYVFAGIAHLGFPTAKTAALSLLEQTGVASALGIALGCYVHIFAAAFGLSAQNFGFQFKLRKMLGLTVHAWQGSRPDTNQMTTLSSCLPNQDSLQYADYWYNKLD